VSDGFVAGLAAAVGAAVLYGSAPVAQAVAARQAPLGRGVGVGLAIRLVRRPIWLIGLAGEVGGFVIEAYAFSAAPATLVAPTASVDLVVFVLLATLVFGARWSRAGIGGAAAMTAAVVLLAVSLHGGSLGRPADTGELVGLGAGCVAVAATLAGLGQRALVAGRPQVAAAAFSSGAGVAYGVATLATRQVGRTFSGDRPWHLLATPTPYVLAVCSVLAIALMQRGLQTGPLLTYPIVSAASAFLPVAVGGALLGDAVPGGGLRIAFVCAFVLVAAGLILIARDRLAVGIE